MIDDDYPGWEYRSVTAPDALTLVRELNELGVDSWEALGTHPVPIAGQGVWWCSVLKRRRRDTLRKVS